MSDLRDQLLKAGLVSADQARDAERAEKKDRRQRGARGQKRKQHQRQQAFADKQRAQAEEHRQRALARRSDEELEEAQHRAQQLVAAHRWSGNLRGKRRWYVVDRKGRVPYLELSDSLCLELERGKAALVQSPAGEITVVTAECARRLGEFAPDWLLFWPKRQG